MGRLGGGPQPMRASARVFACGVRGCSAASRLPQCTVCCCLPRKSRRPCCRLNPAPEAGALQWIAGHVTCSLLGGGVHSKWRGLVVCTLWSTLLHAKLCLLLLRRKEHGKAVANRRSKHAQDPAHAVGAACERGWGACRSGAGEFDSHHQPAAKLKPSHPQRGSGLPLQGPCGTGVSPKARHCTLLLHMRTQRTHLGSSL